MKKFIKDFILNYELFVYVYLITSILWFFPFLGPLMDPILKLEFIWGGILLVYDFFIGKKMFQERYSVLFFAFLVSYCITIVVNIEGQFYMGIKHLIYSAITMLIVFNIMKEKDEETIRKHIYRFGNIIMIMAFVASTISVLMYFFSISIEMDYIGIHVRQGVIDHRLFGIYTSANTGATMALLAIASMFINSFVKNNDMWKWSLWYKVNLVIQIFYFSLTLSRGGQVTFYVLGGTFFVAVLLPEFLQRQSIGKSVAKIIGCFLIFCCITIVLPKAVQHGSMYVAGTISGVMSSFEEKAGEESSGEEESFEIKRIESGDDMSNGRFTIWRGGLNVWKQSPWFGVADIRIDKETLTSGKYDISKLVSNELMWLDRVEGNLHNSYIQILVNSGIVGAAIFVLLAVFIGIEYLKFLMDKKLQNTPTYCLVGLIFTVVVSMLGNCCFENRILFDRQNPYGILFWLYLGMGCSLIELKKVK